MKQILFSLCVALFMAVGAHAQTNTIYLQDGGTVAAVTGARAVIAIDGDRRTTPDFQYDVVNENDFGGTFSADFEVWFRTTSPADGTGGTKAKIFAVVYSSGLNKTYFHVNVPAGMGSNPYIKVKNTWTAFSREFQPSGNGGTLTNDRPHLLKSGDFPFGYVVRAGGLVNEVIPDPAVTYIPDASVPTLQKLELCVFVTGATSGSTAPVINFADDAATISQDVPVISTNIVTETGNLEGYKRYCVTIPQNIQGKGASKIKVKGSTFGTWSSTANVRFGN